MGQFPGKDNTIADILSRWAYPASQALRDISKHGSLADDQEMRDLIAQEKLEERECMHIYLKNPKKSVWVTTRSGRATTPTPDLTDFRPADNPEPSRTPVVDQFGNEIAHTPVSHSQFTPPTPAPVSRSPPRVHFDPSLPPDHSSTSPPISVEAWGEFRAGKGGSFLTMSQ